MFMAQMTQTMPIISVPSQVEVNEEGKGKVTFTNDALKMRTLGMILLQTRFQ